MRVCMKVSIAGIDWSAKPGDEIEVDNDQGMRMCAAGMAVPVAVPQASTPEDNLNQGEAETRGKTSKKRGG